MKTKLPFSIAGAAIFLAAMTLAARSATPPPPPAPKILVIDHNAIMQRSKAGQDILHQVQAYTEQAQKDLKGREAALQAEGQTLQQQIAILSADAKAKKVQAFEAKQAALQNLAQEKQDEIQGGFAKAQSQFSQALGPILQALMQQRGANLLIDRSAVIMATSGAFDITNAAIDLLDQKMTSIKVSLVAPTSTAKH